MNTADQLKRIKELLGAVTGFEDDDQQYVDDARDAVQKLIEALAEQPAQQEPFAYYFEEYSYEGQKSNWFVACPCDGKLNGKPGMPLYTSPQAQRKPLTDGQIVASNYPDGEENGPTIAAPDFELICFARQIEAAHGIKEENT